MGIRLGTIITFVVVLCIGVYLFVTNYPVPKELDVDENVTVSEMIIEQKEKELGGLLSGDIFSLMGATIDQIETEYGKPVRRDKSPFGYESLIYTDAKNEYMQFGIIENRVEMIFATGKEIQSTPFEIGATYDELNNQFSFSDKVSYEKNQSFYSFKLDKEQRLMNPLVQLDDNLFIQLYFDTFHSTLSSFRIISGELLIKQRFYEMEYMGELPEEIDLSDADWSEISQAMEQQILLLTNVYRSEHKIAPLLLDEQTSTVARLHSKDMYENNYFSHNSPNGTDLKDRLNDGEVYYLAAGENIAAQYTDSPSVVEGWLNSEGHRESLLEETFTHIGIGVHRFYFTQNFIMRQ